MSKVRIVTDSDAGIPAHILEKYSIEVIPQVLRVGRERYEDSDEFSADRLFQLIRESEVRRTQIAAQSRGAGPEQNYGCLPAAWARMPRRS